MSDYALIVTPHPVTLSGQRRLSSAEAGISPGESLANVLTRQDVLSGQQWVVKIDGCAVPEPMWAFTKPKHGHLIECRRVPQKDALRVVAIAALAYFTMGTGAAGVGGGLGTGGLFAAGGAIGGGAWAAGACELKGSLHRATAD